MLQESCDTYPNFSIQSFVGGTAPKKRLKDCAIFSGAGRIWLPAIGEFIAALTESTRLEHRLISEVQGHRLRESLLCTLRLLAEKLLCPRRADEW